MIRCLTAAGSHVETEMHWLDLDSLLPAAGFTVTTRPFPGQPGHPIVSQIMATLHPAKLKCILDFGGSRSVKNVCPLTTFSTIRVLQTFYMQLFWDRTPELFSNRNETNVGLLYETIVLYAIDFVVDMIMATYDNWDTYSPVKPHCKYCSNVLCHVVKSEINISCYKGKCCTKA